MMATQSIAAFLGRFHAMARLLGLLLLIGLGWLVVCQLIVGLCCLPALAVMSASFFTRWAAWKDSLATGNGILKNIGKLKSKGFPILIGASRKRFIGEILNIDNPKDRDIGSLAISAFCSQSKIDIVRVHNVDLNKQVLKISDEIYRT